MTPTTVAEVERSIGRPLTKYEAFLVELAPAGADAADIAFSLLERAYLLLLENILGRPLSPAEKAYAKSAFLDGVPLMDAVKLIQNRTVAPPPKQSPKPVQDTKPTGWGNPPAQGDS